MRNRLPVATLREPYWKRQPNESVIAYASYRAFRDLSPHERSIARVSRELKRNISMLEDRALRWRWRERTAAYDEHLDELALRTQEDAVREMNQRHALLALEGLRKVAQRISGDNEAGVVGIDASKLTPQDCSRMVEVLGKLERLARGAESERVEQTGGQPVRIRLAFDPTPNVQRPEQHVGLVESFNYAPPELPPPSNS